ncbi:hypothetical protein ACFXAF_19395 [Kitasatospora sp. NPDC059463]|uniref:hypothetical protein n=1 Tax=unclassified Kitasatospora TaxID=2633591 RepID=UPI0036C14660
MPGDDAAGHCLAGVRPGRGRTSVAPPADVGRPLHTAPSARASSRPGAFPLTPSRQPASPSRPRRRAAPPPLPIRPAPRCRSHLRRHRPPAADRVHPCPEEQRITPEHVSITRDPQYGVVADVGPDASPTAHTLLARAGFRQLGDGRHALDPATEQNVFLHARQTVAALRRGGVKVSADAAFDYNEATRPVPDSPATRAAGPGAVVQAGAPRQHDVHIGRHPRLGIVATNPHGNQQAAFALAEAGFVRTREHPSLYVLDEPEYEGVQRAATAVSTLRGQGLRVASDLAFEPLGGPYESTDPFATRLIEAMDRTPPSPSAPPRADPAEDPFATRLFKAPDLGPVAPPTPKDPFGTVVHPPAGPSRDEQRADAVLHDRVAMSAEIASRLRAIEEQVRTDPGSVDLARVEAVIGEATTVLAGAGKDLAAVAAAPAAPAARTSGASSPPARAALATSGRLRSAAAVHATGAAATATSAQAVDPRIAWAAGHTNSR